MPYPTLIFSMMPKYNPSSITNDIIRVHRCIAWLLVVSYLQHQHSLVRNITSENSFQLNSPRFACPTSFILRDFPGPGYERNGTLLLSFFSIFTRIHGDMVPRLHDESGLLNSQPSPPAASKESASVTCFFVREVQHLFICRAYKSGISAAFHHLS